MESDVCRHNNAELLLRRFIAFYQRFDLNQIEQLSELYTSDISFIDPVGKIEGLLALKRYFRHQITPLSSCSFDVSGELSSGNIAYIKWKMYYAHPRICAGETLSVEGVSELHFTHKIYFQRDYYDLSAMLYDHLPVLGSATRYLKRHLSSH